MLIKACLNGAREPGAHPALPLTPADLALAAKAAVAAGAGAIHMHPRDEAGRQSLEGTVISAAVAVVRTACPGIGVGVSTLFSMLPDPVSRAAIIATWSERPDFASVNFDEPGTPKLCAALKALGIGIEAGLSSAEEAEHYIRSNVFGGCLRVLIEPVEVDTASALATTAAIVTILDQAGDTTPRLLHGMDATAWPVLDSAIARGYDLRIGLEDCLMLPNGDLAPDNAALVAEAARRSQAY